MGVSFTVAGDPGLRASVRRQTAKRTICIGAGFVLVFGCAVALTKLLAESQSFARSTTAADSQQPVDTVVIVATTKKIEKGEKIDSSKLREIRWPRDQVPEGALRTVDEALSLYATSSLAENQPLYRSALSKTAPIAGIQDLLPPGHRAITISVDATSGIEGWATAGAHVDVMLTYHDKDENTNVTRVIVENAVVLSYGGNAKGASSDALGDEGERETSPVEVSTVTLAVPFSQSLRITTAMDMGRISLALRNANDVVSTGDGVFSADQWEKRHVVAPAAPISNNHGYAKLSTNDGKEKQFVLDGDNRWKDNQAEEFF